MPQGDRPPAASDQIAVQKDNLAQLSEISRNSGTTFIGLLLACVYSYLTIATTTDASLLSNSSATPLPIIQVNVPIVWFYCFAPVILTVLFLYFHLYLEQFWRCIVRLPLHHPDGRGLDEYVYPWLISSTLIRGEIGQLATRRMSARIEGGLSLFLAWWLVPIVLIFYWARYLVAHDWLGTLLHISLILLTAAFALRFFYTAKDALGKLSNSTLDATSSNTTLRTPRPKHRLISGVVALVALSILLLYLSASAISGLSTTLCQRAGPASGCEFYQYGRYLWETLHFETSSDVTEVQFLAKPSNLSELLSNSKALSTYLVGKRALVLVDRDLRGLIANDTFLPGSQFRNASLYYTQLRHALLMGARFENSTLFGVELTDADLQYVSIGNTRFLDVVALASRFDYANFDDSTSQTNTLVSGDFSGTSFDHAVGAKLQFNDRTISERQLSFRDASFRETSFTWSHFEDVDFSGASILDSNLSNGTFVRTDFSRAALKGTTLTKSIFRDCKFLGSEIDESVFDDAQFFDSAFKYSASSSTLNGEAALPNAGPSPRLVITAFRGFGTFFGEGTQFRDVHFEKADLRRAKFKSVSLQNVEFSNSDLSGAVFEDVDLSQVKFSVVDLSGANLAKARNASEGLLKGACGNSETKIPNALPLPLCKGVHR